MTEFICCFCESEMSADQIICCDTYKGKMTVQEFECAYGYEFEDLTYEYQDYQYHDTDL
jgi:hypothetical protein